MKRRNALFLVASAMIFAVILSIGANIVFAQETKTGEKTGEGDYFPMHNFKIEIDGVIYTGFTEVSGIESEVEVIEYKDDTASEERAATGLLEKRPGRIRYSNLVLKREIVQTKDDALWTWYKTTMDGKNIRKSMSVIVLDRAGQEIVRYNLYEAWLVKWKAPTLESKGDTHMVEELELAVERVEKA